jgi:hypothetical protein
LSNLSGLVVKPDWRLPGKFSTTQFSIVRLAQLVNGIIQMLRGGKIEYFDIRVLGIILLMIHSGAVAVIWHNCPVRNKWFRAFLLMATVGIYYDLGYLLYYHSLYAEAVTLSSFLMWFATLFYMLQAEKTNYFILIVYFLSSVIFIGSRIVNIPLGIFIAAYSLYFFFTNKSKGKRVLIITGICSILAASLYYYQAIPEWMKKIDNYHSIFLGILKDSQKPGEDLEDLNINPEYAVLAGTNGFMDHYGYDIFGKEFQLSVYDKAGPMQVCLFYLKNPDRLVQKLKISSEAALMIRPPYLGNYTKEDDEEIVKFSKRFSVWEHIRKRFSGRAFLFFTNTLILYSVLILYLYCYFYKKDKTKIGFILPRIMLILFTGIQWILPVAGNGECDLSKHMFLFNLLFDTVLIMLIADILWLLEQNKLNKKVVFAGMPLLLFTFFIVLYPSNNINNKTVVFGKYGGRELTWDIVEETDTHYWAVAASIVENRAFSSGNNSTWADSDIRAWLNNAMPGGFLYEFTDKERNKILTVPRKTILPPYAADSSEFGNQPHHWVSLPGYTTQNYDKAYGVLRDEQVFLLSVREWEALSFKRNKGVKYWLRTPYANPGVVRVVGEDGYVLHKNADMSTIGVLPALYIKKSDGDQVIFESEQKSAAASGSK